jgi:molybdenum cofactor synthesis domain-containing protein
MKDTARAGGIRGTHPPHLQGKAPGSRRRHIATYAALTSSDRGSRGEAGWKDLGGDAIVEVMSAAGHVLAGRRVLPDEVDVLVAAIAEWCDSGRVDIVLTTGGTGLGPRDVMPEAMGRVLDFDVPGVSEAIRAQTLPITPMAMLTRARAGVRGRTLVVNLPGNPKGVRECLAVILPVLGHAADLLRDRHAGPHPR